MVDHGLRIVDDRVVVERVPRDRSESFTEPSLADVDAEDPVQPLCVAAEDVAQRLVDLTHVAGTVRGRQEHTVEPHHAHEFPDGSIGVGYVVPHGVRKRHVELIVAAGQVMDVAAPAGDRAEARCTDRRVRLGDPSPATDP